MIERVRTGLRRFAGRTADAGPPPGPRSVPSPLTLQLPPVRLRAAGVHFRDDAAFLASAVAEARLVVAEAGKVVAEAGAEAEPAARDVPPRCLSILDVGCGAGRLAYGLIAAEAPIDRYEGVDVMAAPIDWCAQTISPVHDAYRFRTIDVYNERYNPAGAKVATDAALPFDDGSFDLVYAFSVFSHMLTADVRAYLRAFARLLAAGGIVMITAFVEEGVPDEAVNPVGYQDIAWGGALHCVRFSRAHVEKMIGDAGLRIGQFDHAAAEDGQSRLLLTRRDHDATA